MSIIFPLRQSKLLDQKSCISTSHIRKLSNNISLIQNSLIQPTNYRKNKMSNLDKQQFNKKNMEPLISEIEVVHTQNYVPLQDAKQMLSQILSKGKKISNLYKNTLKTFELSESNQLITQFQSQVKKNKYLNLACRHILIQYYQLRKLGNKLRGLNSDLLNQIEMKLLCLFQIELKLWVTKKQRQNRSNELLILLQNVKKNEQKFQVIIN